MTERRLVHANVSRLHAAMDAARLACVVVRSGINVTYLAGLAYPGTLARHLDQAASPRGTFVVWPRHASPVIILNAYAERLTRRDSWIEDIEVYAGYTEPPVDRLAAVLTRLGLQAEKVGLETSAFSANDAARLAMALPRMRTPDCTALMDEVRWIKTPEEVSLIKAGADLLDEAYLEVFPAVREGESEREVHGRLVASCIRRGADWAHGILNTHRNPIPYAGESDEPILRGDVVRNDYVAYRRGYPGHQSRSLIMGPPSAEQRRAYEAVRDVHRRTLDRCRPGVTSGEIYAYMVDQLRLAGWHYGSILAGHSVGCWFHQQEPVIRPGSSIPLEADMVIAIEPKVENWHLQDMVLVRDEGGPLLLSDRMPTDAALCMGQG